MDSPDRPAMLAIAETLLTPHPSWNRDTPLERWANVELGTAAGETRVVKLSVQQGTGRLSPAVGYLSALREFSLFRSDVLGPLPEELGHLSRLTALTITSAKNLTGPLPEIWNGLRNLQTLIIIKNPRLHEPIAPSLGAVNSLVFLNLEGVQAEEAVFSLGGARNLQFCRLERVGLKTVPQWLFEQDRLEDLHLSGNMFSGLGQELGRMRGLTALSLARCGLSRLPEALGNLTGLLQLDISGNPLGALPGWLSRLTSLRVLMASDIGLCGPMPEVLYDMPLCSVDLSRNNLSGPLSPRLAAMKELTFLKLTGTAVTGPLPQGLEGVKGLEGFRGPEE